MATTGAKAGKRLDMSNWQKGKPVTVLAALGIPSSYLKYPTPTPSLLPGAAAAAGAAADAAANQSSNPNSQQNVQPNSTLPANMPASAAANRALGQKLAATYGWGTGNEWNALDNLVMGESGWDNTAQNPSSTAYGIGQFLNTTWSTVGGTKTSNPTVQIKLMLAYIKMVYGDPVNAWNKWQSRSPHWY